MKTYSNYINGQFTTNKGETFEVFNPATSAAISRVPESTPEDVELAFAAASAAQKSWAAHVPLSNVRDFCRIAGD